MQGITRPGARERDSVRSKYPAASMRRNEESSARTAYDRPSAAPSTPVRTAAALAAFVTSLVAPNAGATVTLIDDFESAGAAEAWQFSNGSEFPGAQGSASVVPGNGGEALKLAYDFSNGG